MSNQKKYTLTIYVAGAGTPLLRDGKPWMEDGKQLTSDPGHVFYGISEDGGRTIKAYGFAPPHGSAKFDWYSPDKPGKVQEDEHKVYSQQVYRKTIAITQAQYDKLKDFGETPKKYGFNEDIYNWNSRSCIDFVYAALNASNVYSTHSKDLYRNGQKIGTINTSEKAATKVLGNIPEFEKIPNTISRYPEGKNTDELMKNVEKLLPDRNVIQRLLTENEREQPYQYAQAEGGFSPDLQPLHEKARTLLAECNQREGICQSETEFDNTAAYLTTAMQKAKMTDADVIGRMDGKLHVIHDTEELDVAIVDPKTAAQTPVADSVAQSQQTAQRFENEEQQKQYAQSQSRGMSMA